MAALSGETDRAMRSVETSLSRAGNRIGGKLGGDIVKSFAAFFGLQFMRESLEASRDAGNKSSAAYLAAWDNMLPLLKKDVGDALSTIFDATKREWIGINTAIIKGSALISNEMAKSAFGIITGMKGVTEQEVQQRIEGIRKGVQVTVGIPVPIPREKPDLGGIALLHDLESQSAAIGDTARAQEVLNNLRQAGIELDSEWAEKIALTTGKLYDQKQALSALNDLNADLESSTKSFAQALLDGSSATEALNIALRNLASSLLDMAFKNLFNPGGTSLLQTIFGSAFNSPGGALFGGAATGGAGTASVNNTSLGGASSRMGGGFSVQHNTAINVSGSVDQKTLGVMSGMIQRNNVRQNAELQRTWGNRQSRYASLRGP
jgi:hypothetical protein